MFKKKSSKEKTVEEEVPPAPKSPQPSYGGQPDVGGETKQGRAASHHSPNRRWALKAARHSDDSGVLCTTCEGSVSIE